MQVEAAGAGRHAELPAGSYARLTVRDDGPGLEPAVLSRIFEPFFTTKDPGKGTGLGLAVVHGIVTAHGGVVGVESSPARGTQFQIHLPKIDAPLPVPGRKEAVLSGSEHVLLVDDEAPIARFGKTLLESVGYRVSVSTEPSKALASIQSDPGGIDVLVSDTSMPGIDGLELIRRARNFRASLPAVLATGYSDLIRPERLRQIGYPIVIAKPYSGAYLTRAIRLVIDRPNGRANGSNGSTRQEP